MCKLVELHWECSLKKTSGYGFLTEEDMQGARWYSKSTKMNTK